MNTHKITDQDLDRMFQLALQPLAEAQPQRQSWALVVRALVDSPPRWRRLRTWLMGINSPIHPFSSQPICVGGRCVRAPYLDSFSTQMLNLRLAS